jgi:hypothetical protein
LKSIPRNQTALLAADWAAEVTPRVRQIQPDPRGMPLQRFAHAIGGGDPRDRLTILFYITVDEARHHALTRPAAPTELADEPDIALSRWLKQLMYHTQLVAAAFEVQREEIPEHFVSLADEVFETFTEWVRHFRAGEFLCGLLMERQLAPLIRTDDWLRSLIGPANAELWTDHALRKAPQWAHTRILAAEATRTLGVEPP